jgi:hypothetical protein
MLFLDGEMIVSPNGKAWQKKLYAKRAAELIEREKLRIFDPGGDRYRRAGLGPTQLEIVQAWDLIGRE